MQKQRGEPIKWIDGLKGVCAIIVVVHHIFLTFNNVEYYTDNYDTFMPVVRNFINGNFAVSIFIILSSVLTCHTIDKYKGNCIEGYTAILTKRYFRIAIPVGIVIILMKMINACGLSYADAFGQSIHNSWLQGRDTALNQLAYSILLSPFGRCGEILNVGWMLGYVFVGTFLIVIIDILMQRKNIMGKVSIYTLLFVSFWKIDFYYINVIFAYILYNTSLNSGGGRKKFLLSILLFLIFIAFDLYKSTNIWNMLRAMVLVTFIIYTPCIRDFLSNKVFCWLGRLSMNIYLLQLLVIYTYTCRVAQSVHLTSEIELLLYISTIIITIFLAYIFTRWLDPLYSYAIKKYLRQITYKQEKHLHK